MRKNFVFYFVLSSIIPILHQKSKNDLSEFINKFKSKYLWGNLIAMFLVFVLLCVGVKFGIDIYTHHGEAIRVPDIRYKKIEDATRILDDAGLQIVVTDTGYVRSCLLTASWSRRLYSENW